MFTKILEGLLIRINNLKGIICEKNPLKTERDGRMDNMDRMVGAELMWKLNDLGYK